MAELAWLQRLLKLLDAKVADFHDQPADAHQERDRRSEEDVEHVTSDCAEDDPEIRSVDQLAHDILQQVNPEADVHIIRGSDSESFCLRLQRAPHPQLVIHGANDDRYSENELKFLTARELVRLELLSVNDGEFSRAQSYLDRLADGNDPTKSAGRTKSRFDFCLELVCDVRAAEIVSDAVACESAIEKSADSTPLPLTDLEWRELTNAPQEFGASNRWTNFAELRQQRIHAEHDQESSVKAKIHDWLDSTRDIRSLDLLQQYALAETGHKLLCKFLAPGWLQTPGRVSHARRFFPRLDLDGERAYSDDDKLNLSNCSVAEKSWYCFLLLDLVCCDPLHEEAALAHAIRFADKFGVGDELRRMAREEMQIGKRTFERLLAGSEELIDAAAGESAV